MYKVNTKVSNSNTVHVKVFNCNKANKLSVAIEHLNSYNKSKVMNYDTACKICDNA